MGEYCSLLVSIAILARIVISLTRGSVEMEAEAYSMATIIVDIHEHALHLKNPNADTGVKYRTTKLRYAFAIAHTHDGFRRHCLRNAVATNDGDRLVEYVNFLDFHERIRGNIQT